MNRMTKLMCPSALSRYHYQIRSVTCLSKSKGVLTPLISILPLALTSTKQSFRTASNNGNNYSFQNRQIRSIHFTENLLCSCRKRPLLTSEVKDSLLFRRFKSQKPENDGTGKIALWKRLTFVATIGGVVTYMFYSIKRDREIRDEQVRYEEFQKAQLGGDWTLTDHHGNKRSSTEFRGQWILLYFGFTHCPDICPEELEKLVNIVKYFDKNPKLPSMMPIFITLDPERDTPKTIKEYLDDYKCPRLLGFTAPTEEDIKEVATKYRAYFSKGPPDEDNDYIVDHTIIIYLVNPKGEFVNYFDRSRSADRIIKTVTDHIGKFNELEGREK